MDLLSLPLPVLIAHNFLIVLRTGAYGHRLIGKTRFWTFLQRRTFMRRKLAGEVLHCTVERLLHFFRRLRKMSSCKRNDSTAV